MIQPPASSAMALVPDAGLISGAAAGPADNAMEQPIKRNENAISFFILAFVIREHSIPLSHERRDHQPLRTRFA